MAQTSFARCGQAVTIVVSALVANGCVDIVANDRTHVEREEKRFTTTGSPLVDLKTFDGAIEVGSWDRAEVLVTIEKRGFDHSDVASIDVETSQNGNDITVAVIPHNRDVQMFGWHRRAASLFVTVPRDAQIRARSGDGRIQVRDLKGEVSVQTGDGSIRIEDVAGAVDAQSGDGSIRVDGTLTRVRARSGDGSVTVRAGSGSSATDNWNILTGDGSVVVELPATFNAELDAHSGDGRVRVDRLDLQMQRRDDRSTVRGRLGDGGRDLRVRTGDGSITIRQF